jgi:hypothetical protein
MGEAGLSSLEACRLILSPDSAHSAYRPNGVSALMRGWRHEKSRNEAGSGRFKLQRMENAIDEIILCSWSEL